MNLERRQLANAIRALAMDAVQKANSGHPGMPMGMADIAEVIWNDFLKYNPQNPSWPNRDRFLLSNGHGAMLQYALLYLTGYDVTIEDIKNFRQLHSKTPGHPELGDTPGVETTTGPLGQGIANGVGMALAERILANYFNRPGHPIVDHYTYVFAGDGCLMEGVSHEACSLAGTWGLNKLIVFWDNNGISIDGQVGEWFTDNTPARFKAYHWHVIEAVDGHSSQAVSEAIQQARAQTDKPTLICCKTTIGFGAPNLGGTEKAHGSPLGEKEIALARQNLGWPYPPFEIPAEIKAAWDKKERGRVLEKEWQQQFQVYAKEYPQLASEFKRRLNHELPQNWQSLSDQLIQALQTKPQEVATRKASQICLDVLAPALPELIGGSADLTESNCTHWQGSKPIVHGHFNGNYIHYGVREFGMCAIMNGLAVHGGIIPFGGTFLVFSDYARNAIRLSALMRQKVIYIFSHDSIGLGEDGPTHQPIEHAASLRLIPGIRVWRPCDTVETAVAWQQAVQHSGPSCLLLTRQNVAHQPRSAAVVDNIQKGGYILFEPVSHWQDNKGVIIATGSEVQLAVTAAQQLQQQGIALRVVSMPCVEIFKQQDRAYRESVLPPDLTVRIAVEAGVTDYWYQFVGLKGKVIGIDRFGLSAPAKAVYSELGVTVEKVISTVKDMIVV
ncbi:MAG: transketolase [Proteobacteria bacterium]|nr:transketolase [Pseudomonadota bacterium]